MKLKFLTATPEQINAIMQATPKQAKEYAMRNKLMSRYRNEPIYWIKERANFPENRFMWSLNPEYEGYEWSGTPDPLMEIWNGIAKGEFVGVESGTSVGKTFVSALIIIWFMDVWESAKVVCTSNTYSQLSQGLFGELKKLFPMYQKWYPTARITQNPLRISNDFPIYDRKGRKIGEDQRVTLGQTYKPTDTISNANARGIHNNALLHVIEEASSVPANIFNAYTGNLTAEFERDVSSNPMLTIANPESIVDPNHQFCMQDNVKHVIMSSLDHPNVVKNQPNFISGAVTRKSIEDRLASYGSETHPLYLLSVLGQAPKASDKSIIPIQKIYDAYNLTLSETTATGVYVGVDAAASLKGDLGSVVVIEGDNVVYMNDFQCTDAAVLAYNLMYNTAGPKFAEAVSKYPDPDYLIMDVPSVMENYPTLAAHNIAVDATGVGTATVSQFALEGIDVFPIIAGAKAIEELIPTDSTGKHLWQFNNLRSQMTYLLVEEIKNGRLTFSCNYQIFEKFVIELASIERVAKASAKYYQLEPKKVTKRRLNSKSPNNLDALIYANFVRMIDAGNIKIGLKKRKKKIGVHIL